jgi:hypothetical protein
MKKLFVLFALLSAACATTSSETPEQRIAAVEHRLDTAPQWSMAFTTSTTGAVNSHFTGTMNVLAGNLASIDADGFMPTNRRTSDGTRAARRPRLATRSRLGSSASAYRTTSRCSPAGRR